MDPQTALAVVVAFLASSVAQKCADATIDAIWAKLKVRLEPFLDDRDQKTVLEHLPDGLADDEGVQGLVHGALGHTSALRRAVRVADLVQGIRILWVDDRPENNLWESALFRQLGAEIVSVESTDAAVAVLERESFDLVLSDICRGEDEEAGLRALPMITSRCEAPVIFYIGKLDPSRGVPGGAFGITNRPDELLHLVLDVVERMRS